MSRGLGDVYKRQNIYCEIADRFPNDIPKKIHELHQMYQQQLQQQEHIERQIKAQPLTTQHFTSPPPTSPPVISPFRTIPETAPPFTSPAPDYSEVENLDRVGYTGTELPQFSDNTFNIIAVSLLNILKQKASRNLEISDRVFKIAKDNIDNSLDDIKQKKDAAKYHPSAEKGNEYFAYCILEIITEKFPDVITKACLLYTSPSPRDTG
mgnify:FL=1